MLAVILFPRPPKYRDVVRRMSLDFDSKKALFDLSLKQKLRRNKIEIPLNELEFRIEKNCVDPNDSDEHWDEVVIQRVKWKQKVTLAKTWFSEVEEIRIPLKNENDLKCLECLRFVNLYHEELNGLNFDSGHSLDRD